jgi:predicted amidophosphoribosyltransferase
MYRTRLWSRGYNHASYIAKAYSELLSLPVEESLLIRIRPSPQQAKMKHKRERERNIHNVFGVHTKTNLPKNTTIILVDDTTTTHATLYEAKRVLEKAGYTNVRAITLAH